MTVSSTSTSTTAAQLNIAAINAQAEILHGYFLGMQLMVSRQYDAPLIEQWMFKLFRRQHQEKFLSSFEKLGLSQLPDAVACAQYHVLSNAIGGVPVEYMYESDQKAWVRFRYPRWMYDGPTLCGIPPQSGLGFMRGWYAQNGVSLQNPNLGFVCVSEDLTGEFGFCGYFKEYAFELSDAQRLQFAKGEYPPPYIAEQQPSLVSEHWSELRLAKAKRNYALGYIRNGLHELASLLGYETTQALAGQAARLIGLQYYASTAVMLTATDGDVKDAAKYLAMMLSGMGDETQLMPTSDLKQAKIEQTGLRVVRGVEGADRELLLHCWQELWLGTVRSHRLMMTLTCEQTAEETLLWTITSLN